MALQMKHFQKQSPNRVVEENTQNAWLHVRERKPLKM